MPAISLVIPARNREKFIAAAIGSVLRQTETDFELIVWDDGSTDRTVEVAKNAAGDDPRVRIVSAEHGGVSQAINSAAKELTGQYFGWVDSDDGLVNTAMAETRAFLDAKRKVGMVYTNYLAMDEAGVVKAAGSRSNIPYSKDRLLIDFMTFHFRLMRRELFTQLGGLRSAFEPAEDYDLCLRLSEITTIEHLPRPLYLYRVHRHSETQEKRLKQIMASKEAIAEALVRRGMDAQFEVDVELVGRYRLVKKEQTR